jgi:putative flavoprotein involved in K+ transport
MHHFLMNTLNANRYDTIVVGGGQAGLAAGYYLRRAGRPFLILDANKRPGDGWRRRWDSLRLFSPAQYDGLPGMRFPAPDGTFPTKDEMAGYLEGYARHFDLPVANGVRVTRVSRKNEGMVIECEDRRLVSSNAIVATGAYSSPSIPDFGRLLSPAIQQLHSSKYRRPGDIRGNSILVVGFGTSGVEIASDLAAAGHRVWLSGRPTAQLLSKFVPAIFAGRNPLAKALGKVYWNFIHRVVTIDTPLGRKAKAQIAGRGQPLVRLNREDVIARGIEDVPRLAGIAEGRPQVEDGRVLDVSAVVWCTGFRANYQFLDFPTLPLDAKGFPIAPHGIVRQIPGLYFLGLPFQVGVTSTLVGGAGRDAALVVGQIAGNREFERLPAEEAGGPSINAGDSQEVLPGFTME